MEATVQYDGVNQHGTPMLGGMPADGLDLAAWVENRYNAGWQKLTMKRGGVLVGAISSEGEQRTWWAEKPQPEPEPGKPQEKTTA